MQTKQLICNYIKTWETRCYKNGIPDEAPQRLVDLGKVPTYKEICKALLKNDLHLKSLGFTQQKTDIYSDLKYIELLEKGKIKPKNKQLRLFNECI